MYKVKVLKKFCDKKGKLHHCYERNSQGQFIYSDKQKLINVVKEMNDDSAELGVELGAVKIISKIKSKKGE